MKRHEISKPCCLGLVIATISLVGCATASSTTRMLAVQTQESRGMLSLEQANTRQLTGQRAALQNKLAALTQRKSQLSSVGGSSAELQQINSEIAQLKRMIVEQ
jgi:hypothetical protein